MPENQRAVSLIRSWLDAVEIPHDLGGGSSDIVIKMPDSRGNFEVVVKEGVDDPRTAPAPGATVLAKDITGRDIAGAILKFQAIAEAAGYDGDITPIDRGPIPDKNMRYPDNFELVAMRHREFRRTTNPKAGDLEQYRELLVRVCWNFLRINSDFCAKAGIDHGDLMTYALVYATNYLGMYKIRGAGMEDDNKRLLTKYVKQKLYQFRTILRKKMKSCAPDNETAQISTYGQVFTGMEKKEGPHHTIPMEELMDRRQELSKAFHDNLDAALAALPHDKLLVALVEAAEGSSVPEGVRSYAKMRLSEHKKMCHECLPHMVRAKPVVEVVVHMDRTEKVDRRKIPIADRAVPTTGQHAKHKPLPITALNSNELTVVRFLTGVTKEVPIDSISSSLGLTKLQVRNSMRRLVASGWISREDKGTYIATEEGKAWLAA